MQKKKIFPKRPPLPVRVEILRELNESIRDLEKLSQKYNDDEIVRALNTQKKLLAFFNAKQQEYWLQELEEAYAMLPQLSHAVRTWLLFYMEDELAE